MEKSAVPPPYAGFISRAVAFVLDLIGMSAAVLATIALAQSALGFFTLYGVMGHRVVESASFQAVISAVFDVMAAAIAIAYPVGFWVLLGQTPGKLLMGVRITRGAGQPLTVRRALLRYLGYWLSALPLGLGFLWVLIDDRRQAWHDKLADTYVVYDASSPYRQHAPA
jgi:uncharacterized RDD family membrane protein YckC